MSMHKAQEKRRERARLWEEAKEIHERYDGDTLPDDQQEKWDRLTSKIDELKKDIDSIEAREDTAKELEEELRRQTKQLNETKEFGKQPKSAEELNEQHREAFTQYLRSYGERDPDAVARSQRNLREVEQELRATGTQSVGTAGEGGTWVPTDFRASAIEQMKAFGGMRRSRATVITTDNGRDLDMPTFDDSGNVGQIVGEASTFKSTHVPVSKFTLEAVKYGTGPIKLSREILADSAVDIEGVVRNALATRVGRITERHYAVRSSTESTGPHGLINASTGNVTILKGSSNLTPEKLMDLVHSVDPAYRSMGEWMFADEVLSAIRQLRVGSSDNFLWQPGLQAGEPDRLLSYPYIINQSLNDGVGSTANVDQSIANGNTKPIWFGDFGAYFIRDVLDLNLRVLTERYAPSDQIAILGFMRTDGRPGFATSTAALKPIQALLTTTV